MIRSRQLVGRLRAAVWALALASLCAAEAAAQPNPDRAHAIELAVAAQAHFERGEIQEAVDLLTEARARYPEPVLLYNLGRAYEALGLDFETEALEAYRGYVREAPNAPDRAAVERRIESLEAAQAERAQLAAARDRERERAAAEAQRARSAEARAQRARRPSPWPWVLIATGGVSLGAGAVVGGLAARERNDALDAPDHRSTVEKADRASRLATSANLLFIVGAATGATGLTWLVVDRVRARRSVELALAPGSLHLRTRW